MEIFFQFSTEIACWSVLNVVAVVVTINKVHQALEYHTVKNFCNKFDLLCIRFICTWMQV